MNKYKIELTSQGGEQFMQVSENGYFDVRFRVKDYQEAFEKAKKRIQWLKENPATVEVVYSDNNRTIKHNKRGDHEYIALWDSGDLQTFSICYVGEDLIPSKNRTYVEAIEEAMNYKFPSKSNQIIYETC